MLIKVKKLAHQISQTCRAEALAKAYNLDLFIIHEICVSFIFMASSWTSVLLIVLEFHIVFEGNNSKTVPLTENERNHGSRPHQ